MTEDTKQHPKTEFSRLIPADRVKDYPLVEEIVASEEERKALAQRLAIESLDLLEATVTLEHKGPMIAVSGELTAVVMQRCVVTLDPVEERLNEKFTALFAEEESIKEASSEDDLEVLYDADEPEPLEDGCIDIGELTAQYLSLSIDPYPRKKGVEFGNLVSETAGFSASPFAVLDKLKKH